MAAGEGTQVIYQAERNGYEVSDEHARIELDLVHEVLRDAYWSRGVPRSVVERAVDGSLCFGLYGPDGAQAGFGRSVTDAATFAYFSDVFVVESLRDRGLGRFLLEAMMAHPAHEGLRHMLLATDDAHGLYEGLGFKAVPGSPYMNRLDLTIYRRGGTDHDR